MLCKTNILMVKKIISLIITFFIFFSSLNNTFANEWFIEKLLDINYWVEEYNLNLINLNYINFNNPKYNNIYNELKNADSILRNEFMKKYRNWEYEYYQTNWIIINYNNFIYYTNKYLYYTKISESPNDYTELNTAIIRSYRNMRSSYIKVKNNVK
jgi:hypothetical protein